MSNELSPFRGLAPFDEDDADSFSDGKKISRP